MFAQVPALILGAISCAAVATTTFWNQWAITGPTSSDILGPIWAWKYLFGECLQYQGGQYHCLEQESQFLLSQYQISLQAMMITAVFLSALPFVSILLGMECTRAYEDNPNLKRKLMVVSGFSYLFAAILTFASVLWYTIVIVRDFFSIINQDNVLQWELGACVYLGYVSTLLCILTFLACICAQGPKDHAAKSPSYGVQTRRYGGESTTAQLEYFKERGKNDSHKFTDYV